MFAFGCDKEYKSFVNHQQNPIVPRLFHFESTMTSDDCALFHRRLRLFWWLFASLDVEMFEW